MSLIAIRKYMSLDQIAAYETVFNTVINRREPFSAAVAILAGNDPKRDGSAVKKIVDSLNAKFRDAYAHPLLEREQDDTWVATALGQTIYKFSRTVVDNLEALELKLDEFVTSGPSLSLAVRNTSATIASGIVSRISKSAAGVELIRSLRIDETITAALTESSPDILIDDLFYSEKPQIDRTVYRYTQLPRRYITLSIPPLYREKQSIIKEEDGAFVVNVDDVPSLPIGILRQAYSIRAAMEISGARLEGPIATDTHNINTLSKRFKNARFYAMGSIEEVALSLNPDQGYAMFLTEEQTAQLDMITGITHDRVRVRRGEIMQYYNPAIIRRISRFDQASEPIKRLQDTLNSFAEVPEVKIKHAVGITRNYNLSSFSCAHCGKPVEYEDNDSELQVYAPCSHCLSVNQYSVVDQQSEQIKSSKQIQYTDDIYDDVFNCPSIDCSAQFSPIILSTSKGRDFVFCDTCHSIFQSKGGQQQTVQAVCPTDECNIKHSFRVSDLKPVNEISCYNSLRHIRYDRETGIATAADEKFVPERYVTVGDEIPNSFPCPHFGCSDTRSRYVTYNKEGQAFARCNTCRTDIHIVLERR